MTVSTLNETIMQIEFDIVGSMTQRLEITPEFKGITYEDILKRLNSYEYCTSCGHSEGESRSKVTVAATGEVVAHVIDQVASGTYSDFD